ncbi:hypothetical protein [Otariodibacter oris]|uniref:Lipoprotein n=1 Tax=Otariodibacter oris TaxID=1032623 RepID=A0A420XJH3_9PAST|nr:hypothetical protein [Otariodibacter oris]QGM80455.1 hypothetical protein A6A10_03095 [Otariodibacter oris]RKR77399.1 hypothetical protein DES31_0729 [Otariodibacter oris]
MNKATILLGLAVVSLTACSLTPEQQAIRDAKRLRAEQALQVNLAKQCDMQTAELMHEKFNPPLDRTEEEQKAFEKQYLEKVNNPMFQACYKLALQNHVAEEKLEWMRMHYYDDWRGFGFGRFCYACW